MPEVNTFEEHVYILLVHAKKYSLQIQLTNYILQLNFSKSDWENMICTPE